MQPTQAIERERWCEYLDGVTADLFNAPISIEIIDSSMPPMTEANHLALQGVTYDPRCDVFEVEAARGGPHVPSVLRHFVDHPTCITVDGFTPTTILVDGRDGVRTMITIEHSAAFTG
jgi:hypothetical protein